MAYQHGKGIIAPAPTPAPVKSSPLADELKRVASLGDGGDHLQDVIEHGTAKNSTVDLRSPQLRAVSETPFKTAFGCMGASPGGKIPAMLGTPDTPVAQGSGK